MTEHTTTTTSDTDSHPVGTAVGATGGGVTGAVAGTALAGPPGGLIGAAVGAVLGGLAGKETAEYFDPTGEDDYWREHYTSRPYVVAGKPYSYYRPAYAYGWETRRRSLDSTFDEMESDLERGWESFKDSTELTWEQAKDAVRDGWIRVERSFDRMFDDEDEYWRSNYTSSSYVTGTEPYDTYRPAYRYGYRSRMQRIDDSWERVEDDLERSWERFKGASKLTWNEAKEAVRDGWHHIERKLPGDFDNDGR